jgi:hypothetical protein
MKKDRQRTKEKKRVQSFNLSDSCIDKLNHLSDITKAHNKSAIVQRLIEHQYIMVMAKREKAQGKILDYAEPHIQTYEQRVGYANANNLDTPRCNPHHMNGRCSVCDEEDAAKARTLQLMSGEKTFLRGAE